MQEIIKPFEKSLFDKNIKDIGIDMFEIGIDSFLEEGLIKDIPIVGSIVKTGQFIYNLYDRNLLKQTLVFIQQFNNRTIDMKKLEDYRKSLKNDFHKAEKELGRVLIILNKTMDSEKADILAKLYSAYINQNILWNDFCELSEVTDRIFVKDINIIMGIYKECQKGMFVEDEMSYVFQRLSSISLIKSQMHFIPSDMKASEYDYSTEENEGDISDKDIKQVVNIELTQLGELFCSIIK